MHPAYRGLFDYDALKERSNQVYDQEDAALREAPGGAGFNATMNIIGNSQNKQSPWAPYFQNLAEHGVNKVGQDVARPQGIADNPAWGQVGNLGTGMEIPQQPLMASNNFASPAPALDGLRKYHRGGPAIESHENVMAGLANRFGPLGR